MLNRRILLQTALASAALPLLGSGRAQALPEAARTSDLIYLTPILSDGSESRCQAEVWFAELDGDLYVVTASGAWRARAIAQGLTRTRIWVGDEGRWQKSEGRYRALPDLLATASIETDPEVQQAVLEVMGNKYRMSWLLWGPRFRNGLADGTRVMLRYRPSEAPLAPIIG